MSDEPSTVTAYPLPTARADGRKPYDHARHEPVRRAMRWLLTNFVWRCVCKIDPVQGLENFPMDGPAIVMINHIAFLDPVVVMGGVPRNVVPMAKAEVLDLPVWGMCARLWNVIPVHREELDRRALEKALAVLRAGETILVAPEGTRHDSLRDAREGMAYLALKTGAPVVPVTIEGTAAYPRLWFLWRGMAGVRIRVGRPFRFKPVAGRPPRERLRQMTDEAMYVMARMLPEERRGEYGDLSKATTETIEEGAGITPSMGVQVG